MSEKDVLDLNAAEALSRCRSWPFSFWKMRSKLERIFWWYVSGNGRIQ